MLPLPFTVASICITAADNLLQNSDNKKTHKTQIIIIYISIIIQISYTGIILT